MPCNRLPFSIGVGSEIDDIHFLCVFFEIADHIFFIRKCDVLWLKIMFDINAKFFFRQISNMADRRCE